MLDGDYTKALGKLDGGSSFGSAYVGALSDPCQWQRASPASLGIVAGRPGIRVIAERFGINPSTVQRISRPFDGASVAVA